MALYVIVEVGVFDLHGSHVTLVCVVILSLVIMHNLRVLRLDVR